MYKKLTGTKSNTEQMKIIAITPEQPFRDEAETYNALFDQGLEFLHFRRPGCSAEAQAAILKGIEKKFCHKISLHQQHVMAADLGIGGIHFKDGADTGIFTDGIRRSQSLHSMDALHQAATAGLSYVFLSPVFDSISKENYPAAFDFESLKKQLSVYKIKMPVFALGGVRAENLSVCKGLGFAGAAVLGAVWGTGVPNRESSLKNLQKLLAASA